MNGKLKPSNGRRRRSSGSVAIELSLAIPLLLIILLGTADFGRIFHDSIAVSNASRVGVQYAMSSASRQSDTAGMVTAALDDLPNRTGATAAARTYCTCSNGSEQSCSTTCTSKRLYIEVTVTKTFQTLVQYPGIPSSTNLSSKTIARLD